MNKSSSNKWLIFIIIMIASAGAAMNQFKIPPIMSDLAAQLNLTNTQSGWLMSIYDVTIMILVIPSAMLVNKFGYKKVGIISLLISGIASLGGAFAETVSVLMVFRVLEATAQALIGIVAPAVIASVYSEKERGLPMGIWACWVPISILIIYNLAVPLDTMFGLKSIWVFTSALALIAVVLFAIFVKEEHNEVHTSSALTESNHEEANSHSFSTFKNIGIMMCCCLFFGSGFRYLAWNAFAPSYFSAADGLNLSASFSNLMATMDSVGLIIGSVVIGIIFDRKVSLRKVCFITAVLTCIVSLFGFSLIPNTAVVMINGLAIGFLCGCTVNSMWTAVPRLAKSPAQITMGCALLNLFISFGQLCGSPFAGYMIDRSGWHGATVATEVGSIIILIFSIVIFRFRGPNEVKSKKDIVNNDQVVA